MKNSEVSSETFDFSELVGEEFDFYGVNGECFKLDGRIYEAAEDEDRHAPTIAISNRNDLTFHTLPIARVVIEESDDERFIAGYQLIDLHDGHCWLHVGVDLGNCWYHDGLTFDYFPESND